MVEEILGEGGSVKEDEPMSEEVGKKSGIDEFIERLHKVVEELQKAVKHAEDGGVGSAREHIKEAERKMIALIGKPELTPNEIVREDKGPEGG